MHSNKNNDRNPFIHPPMKPISFPVPLYPNIDPSVRLSNWHPCSQMNKLTLKTNLFGRSFQQPAVSWKAFQDSAEKDRLASIGQFHDNLQK